MYLFDMMVVMGFFLIGATSQDCDTFTSCKSCASAKTWTGAPCRWCPLDNDMSCHTEGSLFNKCSSSQQITDASKCPASPPTGSSVPRNVYIKDQQFIDKRTNEPIVLRGPNVVVKGPPYLPTVSGDAVCKDIVDDACTASGSCTSCTTFNQADIDHMRSKGWNTIRLGIAWAGAQPKDENALDPEFLTRLHAVLNLTDANGIHVVLDNHGDMVGSANCGNGVPMWLQKKAAPDLIGKPLTTGFPYSLVSSIDVKGVGGYDFCGSNESKWAEHAGDPNYNLLNECCQKMNGPNPAGLGWTTLSQKTMDFIVATEGGGRADFVRYWSLIAEAVVHHQSAVAAELMNEPMSIRRSEMYDTWRACAEAINAIIPDMSVALSDTGEGAILPAWVEDIVGAGVVIDDTTVEWIKASSTVFYAWHWYGNPSDPADAVKTVQALSKDWNVPSFATEFMSCSAWKDAAAANISHSYWHYSAYCTTGQAFGNRAVPTDTFGACILGWAGGDSNYTCN